MLDSADRYSKFRKMLVTARKECGLTQSDVAAELQQPQSFVSKYETGERRLDLLEFMQVAATLRLDVASFIAELLDDP